MPARSERMPGNAASGVFSFSVTCIGPVTAADSIAARSALMLDFGSLLLRSRLNLTASASSGVPSWKVTPARMLSTSVVGIGKAPALGEAGLGLQRLELPFGQRVVHREQEGVIRAGAAGGRIEARRIGGRRDAQDAAALRRALRECVAAEGRAGQRARYQRHYLASRVVCVIGHFLRRVVRVSSVKNSGGRRNGRRPSDRGISSRQSGVFFGADGLRILAAGAEAASRRRIDRARNLALQHDAAVAAHGRRQRPRLGRQQRLGIGMQRPLGDLLGRARARRSGRDTSPRCAR